MSDPRPKGTEMHGKYPASGNIKTLANGTPGVQVGWKNDTGVSVELTDLEFIPESAVTGDDTNFFSLSLVNKGLLGVGAVVVSTIKDYTSGVNMVAFKPESLTDKLIAAAVVVAPGEVLVLDKTETGSGLTLPNGKLTFRYKHQ